MNLRFRRRLHLAPGLSLNLGKRGASVSLGERGAHATFGRHGSRTTLGLPGTGLSATKYRRYKSTSVSGRPGPLANLLSTALGFAVLYAVARLFGWL